MAILGYSERGIFNSIVYYLNANPAVVHAFLKKINVNLDSSINNFTFLVGQSYADHGICDLTIIGEGNGRKIVLFIDGKGMGEGSVKKQFESIRNAMKNNGRPASGNIFYRLYCMYYLQLYIKAGKFNVSGNPAVLRSCELIANAQDFCYIAILPQRINSDEFVKCFAAIGKYNQRFQEMYNTQKEYVTCGFWGDIYAFFREMDARDVVSIFEYNEGLIFEEPIPAPRKEPKAEPWYGSMVFVKSKKDRQIYHLLCETDGSYIIRGPVNSSWDIVEESARDIEKYCALFNRYTFVSSAGELNLSYPKNLEDFKVYLKNIL
jgi:hypothetical protein